jgi:adenylosuccinate synthase
VGKLQIVVGGQFGSEAKGAVAGYLADKRREPNLMAIRVGGPNAGHTVYDNMGEKWALRQVPVAAVTNADAFLRTAAGSEIDIEVMEREVRELGVLDRYAIDAQATVIEEEHKARESHGEDGVRQSLVERIGSTGKGIGAARADRIMRTAGIWDKYKGSGTNVKTIDVAADATEFLSAGYTVQLEAAQGYGLGLHAGFYPQCTSDDCRAIDACSKAGVSPWAAGVDQLEVWVVFRIFPIRVAGNSGPLKGETTWEELGLPPEYTTVTKKVRRVGLWDDELAKDALTANGAGSSTRVALMMLDQLHPEDEGKTTVSDLSQSARNTIDDVANRLGHPISLVGTGPQTITDLRITDPFKPLA